MNLGQAKSFEEMMSQITKNMFLVENLYNVAINRLRQPSPDIEIVKKELE